MLMLSLLSALVSAVLVAGAPSSVAAVNVPVVPTMTDEDTVIFYDDGAHHTWWTSDKDSFGVAVKFTPAEWPCELVGARAEVGYDLGQQVFLRVFDDSAVGKPGKVLYEEQRLDIPHGQNTGFRDYDLTAPIVIDSGDFYVGFWQKHWFHLLFGSDAQMNYAARQWWWFPGQGWVPPSGLDAADHLIRAKVRYGTGVEEELGAEMLPRLVVTPNPAAGVATAFCPGASSVSVYDAAGMFVRSVSARDGKAVLTGFAPGAYVVVAKGAAPLVARFVVVR